MGVQLEFGFGHGGFDSKKPCDHPFGIGIHRRLALVIGDGGYGAGCISTDPRQRAQSGGGAGKFAAHLARHNFGRRMQIAGAGVIAKPGPGGQHLVLAGGGQRRHVGPEAEKFAVISGHRLHRGLLQHDFRQPDAIRIGAFSPWCAPGQHAAMDVVPGEQFRRDIVLFCGAASGHNPTMAQPPSKKQTDAPPPRRGRAAAIGRDAGPAGAAVFARAGFTDPALILHWADIAGPEVARIARPLRFSEKDGTLTLMAEPGAALFLSHESRALAARINAWAGRSAITRVKFVQGKLSQPPPRPAPPPGKAPESRRSRPRLSRPGRAQSRAAKPCALARRAPKTAAIEPAPLLCHKRRETNRRKPRVAQTNPYRTRHRHRAGRAAGGAWFLVDAADQTSPAPRPAAVPATPSSAPTAPWAIPRLRSR